MRGVPVVWARMCVCVWLGHTLCILRHVPFKICMLYAYCILLHIFREKISINKAHELFTEFIETHIIYVHTSKACSDVDGVKGIALPAPLAGLAVLLSVAQRGQRCQGDGRGSACHARSTPAVTRTEHASRPGTRDSHAHLHLHLYIQPYPTNLVRLSFPLPSDFNRCMCVFMHVGWLAMPSVPSAASPSRTPFPLITRVGLTICVPVCSHIDKRGTLGGCGAGIDSLV